MELDDLVYEYPSIRDDNFQAKMSLKLEFLELASSIKEPTPERGQAYKHQELIRRFMLVLDRLLMIHETGTGKSCAVFRATDLFNPDFISRYRPPSEISTLSAALADYVTAYIRPQKTHIKKTIILTNGKTLADNLKRQFVCVCSYKFETDKVKTAETKSRQKNVVTRSLQPFYEFQTYRKFAKGVKAASRITVDDNGNMVDIDIPESIIEVYSNTMFVLEEAHNLRTEFDPSDKYATEESPDVADEDDKLALSNKSEVYLIYRKLFESIRRAKIIAMTATPAVDNPDEIRNLLNLLRPAGDKIITPFRDLTDPEMEAIARRYFNGYVSYVRSLDSGVDIETQGFQLHTETGEPLKTKIYPLAMQPFQQRVYLNSTELSVDTKKQAARLSERQAASFVGPDGSYKAKNLTNFMKVKETTTVNPKDGSVKIKKTLIPTAEFKSNLQNPEQRAQMSAKYNFLLNLANETFDEKGIGYAFFDFVGTGANIASEFFEANGWENFDTKRSMFSTTSISKSGFCGVQDKESLEPSIKPAKRFGVFTGGVDPFYMLEALNSPQNAYGRYLKWIFASPVSAEGVSFKDVTTIVLINGAWNMTGTLQRTGRAIRSGGWDQLIKKIKQETGRNPNIKVKIYQLATYTQESYNRFARSGFWQAPPLQIEGKAVRGYEMFSIDAAIYREAERKDREIQKVMKYLKWSSIDCIIHRIRNQRSTDVPGSSICHYDEDCEYGCMDDSYFLPKGDTLDEFIKNSVKLDSYLVLYSSKIVDRIIDTITKLLYVRSEFLTSDIVDLLVNLFGTDPEYYDILGRYLTEDRTVEYSRKLVDLAIEKIINRHQTMVDRFGFIKYIVEDQSLIKLSSDFPTVTETRFDQIPLSGYASMLIANERSELSSYIKESKKPASDLLSSVLENPENQDFDTLVRNLSMLELDVQNEILELAYLQQPTDNNIINGIIERYKMFIFNLPELSASFTNSLDGKISRIEIKDDNVGRLINRDVITYPDAPTFIINTFPSYGRTVSGTPASTKFNWMSNFLNPRFMRILQPGSDKWRDTTESENLGYNQVIQAVLINLLYNVYAARGRFTVVYNYANDNISIIDTGKVSLETAKNSKELGRGKSWKSWSVPALAYISANLEVDINDIIDGHANQELITERWNDDTITDDEIRSFIKGSEDLKKGLSDLGDIDSLVTRMSDNELRYVYAFGSETYRKLKDRFPDPIMRSAIGLERIVYI